jgi:hypothetical protein
MTTDRPLRAAALGTGLILAGSSVFLPACGDEETSGKRITLQTRVVLSEDDAAGFTTGLGWTVTPRRIVLGSGPLYYFDGVPPLARRDPSPSFTRIVRRFFTIGSAHAHPGHYQSGNALGQMLEPYTEDLLDGPVDLPGGTGVTGTYRSARFSFAESPSGPDVDVLDGHAAVVTGLAEKDGEEPREFVAVADYAEIARSQANAEINGCVFDETEVGGEGTVTVTVSPHVWFQLVDFAEIAPGTEAAPTGFEVGSRPRVAFSQGLAQLSAYTFAFSD